ncbi:farnesyl pyrophosphate synthase-like isoform X2 [Diabrotica virgifera virgifera]|uniref:Farnesyl pyrophosphate synthase-like n=1 Tax=Diabrotica virgifera virgifera TaxID=50390 RepID=A0ABM5JVG1_DIAVI|nr:farnesyl pyrophosphate synthase-like isoform X2 [Diabrotica virgifera virgifera]
MILNSANILKGLIINPVKQAVGVYRFSLRSLQIDVKDKNPPNFKNRQRNLDFSFEEKALLSVYPDIREEILREQLLYHKKYPDLHDRFSKLLDYNLKIDPKYLARAIFFVHAYRILEKPSLFTQENLRKACVLGWCHKLIDSSIVVDDDIADASETRYNKPTWYTLPDVGVNKAILDAAFLESGANFLIINHLSYHPQCFNIQKSILKTYSTTNVAQVLEIGQHRVEELEKYQDFVKFYFFTLPLISSALYLANIVDKDAHACAEEICTKIAKFQKIEDDVTCVFSPISDIQKACTDISEGRATWLAIEAYKRGSENQRKVLEQHYGVNNKESVANVYKIFKVLKLKEAYDDFKEVFYEDLYFKIHNKLPKTLPPKLFIDLLDFAMSGKYRV